MDLLDIVSGGFVGGGDPFCGLAHLTARSVERREEVHVVTDPVDDVVGLDGVSAREGVPVVLGKRVQPDADQLLVQFVH
ncbi:hypothetical protein [Streptomyces demainii]|uniref:Uncharacterized protein n=1 Tax=Streptomyces demainii TaxID=588122 RepID=A0ABT9KK82_9ACTN|nr:hypothetical protein [Streptomyces demainii]MDP9608570.1 hypothetical protein [Streptomyces demainii]